MILPDRAHLGRSRDEVHHQVAAQAHAIVTDPRRVDVRLLRLEVDPMAIKDIKDIKVVETIKEGETIYAAAAR